MSNATTPSAGAIHQALLRLGTRRYPSELSSMDAVHRFLSNVGIVELSEELATALQAERLNSDHVSDLYTKVGE